MSDEKIDVKRNGPEEKGVHRHGMHVITGYRFFLSGYCRASSQQSWLSQSLCAQARSEWFRSHSGKPTKFSSQFAKKGAFTEFGVRFLERQGEFTKIGDYYEDGFFL